MGHRSLDKMRLQRNLSIRHCLLGWTRRVHNDLERSGLTHRSPKICPRKKSLKKLFSFLSEKKIEKKSRCIFLYSWIAKIKENKTHQNINSRFFRGTSLWHSQLFTSSPFAESNQILGTKTEIIRRSWLQILQNIKSIRT